MAVKIKKYMSPPTWMPRCLQQCPGKSAGYQACKVGLRFLQHCTISYSLPFFHIGIFLWFEPQMKSIGHVLRKSGNSSWLRIQTNTILFWFFWKELSAWKQRTPMLFAAQLFCSAWYLFFLVFQSALCHCCFCFCWFCCCCPGSLVLIFFFPPCGWFHMKLDAIFCQTHPVWFIWAQILVIDIGLNLDTKSRGILKYSGDNFSSVLWMPVQFYPW